MARAIAIAIDDKPGLAAAGHEVREPLMPGLTPQELAELLAARIEEGIGYARRKRRSFRAASSWTKSVSLALSAASTIILGPQDLSFWAGLGFALGAAVTVVNAVEPFFNWRSRWVLMEELVSGLYRLHNDRTYLVAHVPAHGRSWQ